MPPRRIVIDHERLERLQHEELRLLGNVVELRCRRNGAQFAQQDMRVDNGVAGRDAPFEFGEQQSARLRRELQKIVTHPRDPALDVRHSSLPHGTP